MLKIIVERHQELPPVAMPMLPYLSVDRGGKLVPLKIRLKLPISTQSKFPYATWSLKA
jgi:hypothetical protein